LPPKARSNKVAPIPRNQQYSREPDYRDSNGSFGVTGESANGEYGSEYSGRSNNSSFRASPGVPKDRLKETATQGDFESRNGGRSGELGRRSGDLGRTSPDRVYSGSLGTLLRSTKQQHRTLGKHYEAAIEAAVATVQEPIPPSSILNHHRNGPARAAAVAAALAMTSNPSKHSRKSMGFANGGTHDDSHSYPRHLKVNLIRSQSAEPSGGSFESLNDEVWESARESLVNSEHYDRSARAINGNSSNMSESAQDYSNVSNASGWPLVKIQPLYARTPSSDSASKDASFSSVSERSLRSPTNLALTVQDQKDSPNSVLQPPPPKAPADSWLLKVRPPAPPTTGTNWRATKPKKVLDYSTDDSMDVKR
jgi:hypothetical protein